MCLHALRTSQMMREPDTAGLARLQPYIRTPNQPLDLPQVQPATNLFFGSDLLAGTLLRWRRMRRATASQRARRRR